MTSTPVAVLSAVVLVGVAWLVLARARGLWARPLSDTVVVGATRTGLGLLVLTTLANLAAPHPVERWVLGSITLVVVALVAVVAVAPSDQPTRTAPATSREDLA